MAGRIRAAKRGARSVGRSHARARRVRTPVGEVGSRIVGRAARLGLVCACAVALLALLTAGASAAGPGGWDHLGDGGAAGTSPLNGAVYALDAAAPNALYVGGSFTSAGGNPAAAHIALWDGSAWHAV